jgi:hypothetical protein
VIVTVDEFAAAAFAALAGAGFPAARGIEAAAGTGDFASTAATLASAGAAPAAAIDGDDVSRAASSMAAAMTQTTRSTAPAPIIRVVSGAVSAAAGAVEGSGFFGDPLVFADAVVLVRVDFFKGIRLLLRGIPWIAERAQRSKRGTVADCRLRPANT